MAAALSRWRGTVMERRKAVASSSTFFLRTGSIVVPSMMGWAAPALVPGAITARSADSSRKKPAEPARLPVGSMKMMTGTGERSMAETISRVEVRRPPGVPRDRRTASACWAAAASSPRWR